MAWKQYQPDGTFKTAGDGVPPAGVVFQAQRTTGSNADGGVCLFDTKNYDPYGWYDTSTGRFTPKIAGYYDFGWDLVAGVVISADAWFTSALRKNGTEIIDGATNFQRGATFGCSSAGTGQLYLNGSTDYADVVLHHSNGGTVAYNTNLTRFFGELAGVSVGVTPEPWHIVGATGEPAFAGTWANFGSGWSALAFMKDPHGFTRIRGTVQSGTGTIFTLPAGYRPAGNSDFAIKGNSAYDAIRITASTGTVAQLVGSGGVIALDGINFRAEQ